MSDIARIVPRAPEPTQEAKVHALTVEVLTKLLALAQAGEIVDVVAVSWHGPADPQIHMSTVDKITALGAIRTMEHCLVREWLDGRVSS